MGKQSWVGLVALVLAILVLAGRGVQAEVQPLGGGLEVVGETDCTTLSVSTSSASASLSKGVRYEVVSSVRVHLRVGATATTSASPIPADVPVERAFSGRTETGTVTVHGITASGSGTVHFCKIREAR